MNDVYQHRVAEYRWFAAWRSHLGCPFVLSAAAKAFRERGHLGQHVQLQALRRRAVELVPEHVRLV